MTEDKKNGGNFALPSTGMFVLAFAVIGLIWSGPSPLIGERPIGTMESGSDKERIQDVDARMWQDPLGAVRKKVKRTSSQLRRVQLQSAGNELKMNIQESHPPEENSHSPETTIHRAFFKKQKQNGKQIEQIEHVFMLAAMISGGPYPEEEEGRRRNRYAVLSALATLNFEPVETEHIGYFVPKLANPDQVKKKPKPDEKVQKLLSRLPDVVPFELFDREQNNLRQRVIILWLDDDYFSKHIDNKLKKLFEIAKPAEFDENNFRNAVIGPNKSSQLKTLLDESKDSALITRFYSAGATVDPSLLTGNKQEDQLVRTIGNDRLISNALVEELKLRQITPKQDHVLLISEWDTFYGRSLPATFTKAYAGDKAECLPMDTKVNLKHEESSESNVHCVNYMRGIDGILPETSGQTDQAQDASKKAETIQVNNNIDRPSGNNQKDYLRRLVDQIRKLDANIRSRNSKIPYVFKNNGISAIGVLGSDVYDKLMILQALRPFFPGKLFFTTDLDAAYFSPQELPYTHNLIVGSSFGLSLAPELQKSIPPFRDSYQTSTFFSTVLATSRDKFDHYTTQPQLDKWLRVPRIFEIGRKGAVDLSKEYPSNNPDDCEKKLYTCDNIHPDPDNMQGKYMSTSVRILKGLSLILGLVLLYRMSWKSRWLPEIIRDYIGKRSDSSNKAQTIASLASMLPLVAVGLIVIGIVLKVLSFGKYEPFYWGNGVSIWPSNLLVFLAVLISCWLYKHSWEQLKKIDTAMSLEKNFSLRTFVPVQNKDSNKNNWLDVHTWKNRVEGDNIVVEILWQDYQYYGKNSRRLVRSAINTVFFMLFGSAAIMLSGGLPVPTRGPQSFYFDAFLEIACVIAVVFLIMWLVDAARLFSKFIEHLAADQEDKWPGDLTKWGWPEEHVIYWIDIQFVAQYTKAMEKFIWYPIPPLLLMGAARSTVFDNWTFSAGLLASVIILLIYLFSVAFLLQHGAKEMRAKAVRMLGDKLRVLRGQYGSDEKKISQLEKMIVEIKCINEGAFTPFIQQPMVQALLAFLSGSGGIAVLMERFL